MSLQTEPLATANQLRFVTATSLYDGHDAAINIIRRVLQSSGTEVIHLGHNRSALEIVEAAIQEDAHAIAVSSYQGGHMYFFRFMYDMLQERNAGHIRIFGGGGGVIIPGEIAELEEYGIQAIYSPEHGASIGMQGIINDMRQKADYSLAEIALESLEKKVLAGDTQAVARAITLAEMNEQDPRIAGLIRKGQERRTPVVGLTGTGGAGKSSLTDELIRRFVTDFTDKKIAVVSSDPTKKKTGGALLGDRIRMNALASPRTYMRSLATRRNGAVMSAAAPAAVNILKAAGYDLIIMETSGIGQGNMEIVDQVDLSLYVMTREYGAPSQLEKIDMIDFADLVVLNKFEKQGSDDALRDVRKQYRRSHQVSWDVTDEQLPVYPTIASRFNCRATDYFYQELIASINRKTGSDWESGFPQLSFPDKVDKAEVIPGEQKDYLRHIVETVRSYKESARRQSQVARNAWQIRQVRELLTDNEPVQHALATEAERWTRALSQENRGLLKSWSQVKELYREETYQFKVRDRIREEPLYRKSLAGLNIPRVALPSFADEGALLEFLLLENLPGYFPYTAGVFPFKRTEEEPKRQFAGEGPPIRTNRRFHFLSENDDAKRLSTAFDSVTLYGEDPAERPDIYGKVGESGVSICSLDDMKILYDGFDLSAPATSVSMTINGPAPMMLAMYLNTAIDQNVSRFEQESGRTVTPEERQTIADDTLKRVRGTVQADILKEDQAQNTCIFSVDFSLKLMGDIQEYFVQKGVRNYYSVSISGYHIAEAGANPITQVAFTMANGFTYVEYYRSRGMHIDQFAHNLSFFFSNGLDPEYSVIGRVARRIWAIAVKHLYSGNERSQKLKYHIQTSGRSLHAQEMQFNDIRTTLQALLALYDNCNSLHTNAYDEAVTTPSEESVRRAMAIQMIINREYGVTKNENPIQGAFIVNELTELVEEAILNEFLRLNERGGVLGAMELQYQRSRIQEESMVYEMQKESGQLPIIGVNTYLDPNQEQSGQPALVLARASEDEKQMQLDHVHKFQNEHSDQTEEKLRALQDVARNGGNIFAELMETVRHASLGQITNALYEVGGQYRRNM